MPELKRQVWLAQPRAQVFAFFADPANLQVITPDWLDFSITAFSPAPIQTGTLIDYRLRLHGIPIQWTSEISVWEPPSRFVDEQRRGPYRRWRHEHRFEDQNGGTLVSDFVAYAGFGGRIFDILFIRRDLKRIFEFREERLIAIFGGKLV